MDKTTKEALKTAGMAILVTACISGILYAALLILRYV